MSTYCRRIPAAVNWVNYLLFDPTQIFENKMESSVEKANPLAKKLAKIQDNQFENDKVL